MTCRWSQNRRLTRPASLCAAVTLALTLGPAGNEMAQAAGPAVSSVEVALGNVLNAAGNPANKNGVLNLALSAKSSNSWDIFGFSRLTKTDRGANAPGSLPHWGTPQAATLHLVPLKAGQPALSVCPGILDEGPVVGSKLVTATVGGTWTTLKKSTTWMVYGANQSSSLGIGVMGPFGSSFAESGTVTITSGLKETYPKHTGNQSRLYRTDWVYERYNQCGKIFVQAKEWAGGKIVKDVGALKSASKCVPELAGQSEISSGTAATFQGGVSIAQDIGINLTAQTDYSATAAIFFQVHGDVHAKLCGTTDFPGGTNPGFVEQKP
jgi:hypothetical protein